MNHGRRITCLAALAAFAVAAGCSGADSGNLSGNVFGACQSGVTMTLTGAASLTETTDVNGYYQFTGLLNGEYEVTPTKSGCKFTPLAWLVNIEGKNSEHVNFNAVAD